MTSPILDRRRSRRRPTVREHGIEGARVRRGVHVTVIDASAGGVLIETGHRLLPGMPLDIHLVRNRGISIIRGRVLRCAVVHLTASSVRYRGAIAFDQHLPWLVEDVEMGSSFTAMEGQ
jgi:PilZ domain